MFSFKKIASITFVLALLSNAAIAQDLNIQNFKPTVGPHSIVTVEGANTLDHLSPAGGLLLNYGSQSLVLETKAGKVTPLVDQQLALHAFAGIGFYDFMQFDISMPFYFLNEGTLLNGTKYSGMALGDLSFQSKATFISSKDGGLGLGFLIDLSIPTGDNAAFVGMGSIGVTPKLLVDGRFGDLFIAANLGASIRKAQTLRNLEQGSAVEYGAGVEYSLLKGLFLIDAELYGRTSFNDLFATDDSPLEAIVGGKLVTNSGLSFAAGAGGGLVSGAGAPSFRTYLSFGYAPRSNDFDGDGIENNLDACVDIAEDLDGFEDEDGCPDEDNDQDQILDTDDKCPMEAEDLDGFEDEDGCPETDNDKDEILDADDKCPNDAEDKNGFEDEDGCPDGTLDSDKDGIKNAKDKCVNEPEDMDGFEDEDGCPDNDNDHDGIQDADDKCPNKPGLASNAGCPAEKPKAVLKDKNIQILEKVFFESDKAIIKSDSYSLLDEVALILKTNTIKVEVGGHTDDKGKDDYNMQLSTARAKSVEIYLRNKGVSQEKLSSVGYGEMQPLEKKKSKSARAKNRRVEFKIIK